jgi:hypothetical protein
MVLTIDYKGRELEVSGTAIPAQSWGYDDMPEPEYFDVKETKYKGREVSRFVDGNTVAELALENYRGY